MMVAGIASLAFFNWQPEMQTFPDGTEVEMRLTEALNKLRLDRGLQPLTSSADLTFIARRHSKDMATRKLQ
ncbi:MAG: CAP domain-containing protein [Dehalococcoidia bacterium]|nr:CAP domain-containing protein [Dehalococcoidia bacterium]